MDKFLQELAKEIDLYNRTSGGYEIKIGASKILNQECSVSGFHELVAKLYEIAKG